MKNPFASLFGRILFAPAGGMSADVLVQFANAAAAEQPIVLVEICNELKLDADGWCQIAPLGDYPGMALTYDKDGKLKKEKAIQRIDAQAVANMVNSYSDARGGPLKFLKGAPIYNGHPDIKGYEARYPDKNPKGVFAAVKNGGANGLIGEPVFTNDGLDLIEVARAKGRPLGMSGRWDTEYVGEENGVKVYRPKNFISAGLTATPNLPVQMLNEAEVPPANQFPEAKPAEGINQNHKTHMKKKILALVAALSLKPQFANAVEPTEAEQETALGLIEEKVTSFANEQMSIKTKLLGLCKKVGLTFVNESEIKDVAATVAEVETKVATIANERDAAKTEAQTAKTNFANERSARIKDALDGAITAGRITAAERTQWETRLGNETQFANELAALGKLEAKVKTNVVTIERNGKKVDIANEAQRTEIINELIAEEVKAGKTVEGAWATVETKHPALFGAMKHPKIEMPKKH